jgi:hypothetical protein
MSAQANIVAFDGAATPVTHTFTPAGALIDSTDGFTAMWREINAALPTYAQIQIKTTQKQLKSGVWRVSLTAAVPVMESISGQNAAGYTASPKVAYTNTVSLVGYFSERATPAERRLARQLVINMGNNISTTVAAATTGPASELIDSNITAS